MLPCHFTNQTECKSTIDRPAKILNLNTPTRILVQEAFQTAWHNSPIHLFIFSEDKVVAGEGDAEDDGSDALEAVDPLLPLRPLAPHVKHPGKKQLNARILAFPQTGKND